MELIFDSVEERDEFFRNTEDCPGDHGLYETPDCLCRPGSDTCVECWKNSGVKYSVKEKKQEYDKEPSEPLPTCENCKHRNNAHNWPCMHCGCITKDMFEPKDAE